MTATDSDTRAQTPWRVLIIDDSPDDRAEIRRLLMLGSDRRFKFQEADTGADGVRKVMAEGTPPDCILLDYNLPDMEAPEVLLALAKADGSPYCPVVVLTGADNRTAGRQLLRAGAQDFLGKISMTSATLTRALENASERWALARELEAHQTALQHATQRDACRLSFGEATHSLGDPDAIKVHATRVLADHFQATRVLYYAVGPAGHLAVEQAFPTESAPSSRLRHIDDCTELTQTRLREGRGIAVNNVATESSFSALDRSRLAEAGVGSFICAPVLKFGRLRALVSLHRRRACEWSPEDLALVEEIAERTWSGIQRATAEIGLRRNQRELQALADNTPDILMRFDRDFRHVFVNDAAALAIGHAKTKFIGKRIADLGLPEAHCSAWEHAMQTVFDSGSTASIEFSLGTPAGNRYYTARMVPETGSNGDVEYILSVAHDVTERELNARALAQHDQRKDEFLATLAHELRNPLAPLRTGLEVLRLAPVGTSTVRTLDMMDRQLGQMVRLIDDLLDISRITSGKIVLRNQRVSLQSVVHAAVESVQPMLVAAHHALVLELPLQPILLDADTARLAQVVGNLLTNSVKYTPSGGRITVSARQTQANAVLVVSDTGYGIPAEMHERVFDMFTQVNRTLQQAQGGLGIGLALVKRLVEMHGGSVVAQSQGHMAGSQFTVCLPLANPAVQAAPAVQPTHADKPAHTQSILVVDDNIDAAEALSMVLDLLGCASHTAFTGLGALAAAQALRPDSVFLDIGLPDLTGYEVARRMRAIPALDKTLLVALTGWGSEEDRNKARDAGFDRHLTKPVAMETVEAILNQVATQAVVGATGLDVDAGADASVLSRVRHDKVL